MANIAAHRDRFATSKAVAESTAFLLVHHQLLRGVRSEADLRVIADVVGSDAFVAVLRALAPNEQRRLLTNIGASPPSTQEGVRRLLARYTPGVAAETAPPSPEPATPRLRRHQALGARRIRSNPSTE